MVKGFPLINLPNQLCEGLRKARNTQVPKWESKERATKLLELMHTSIRGPFEVDLKWMLLTLLMLKRRKTWIYFQKDTEKIQRI